MNTINFSDNFLMPVLELRTSDTKAFCIANELYSYKIMFDYVEQIYEMLSPFDDELVGLYSTDDIRTYASIIALWLLGKAYVPLNPVQPRERHIDTIESAGIKIVLSADKNYK